MSTPLSQTGWGSRYRQLSLPSGSCTSIKQGKRDAVMLIFHLFNFYVLGKQSGNVGDRVMGKRKHVAFIMFILEDSEKKITR